MDKSVSFIIPMRIESPRLILRAIKNSDWRALHEYYSDPECVRFTFCEALSEGESWRAVASMAGHWLLHGYGPYVLEEKATGAVIGVAGLWYPNDWPEPEIKWALARQYWGKGFASEAVRAIQRMAHEYLSNVSLISFIHGENTRSINLALAVGAKLEKEVGFQGNQWHIYRHPLR